MALKGCGMSDGVRRWLWFALLLTSASSAATGNVALRKPAKASSLLNSTRFNAEPVPACLAVKGNRSIVFTFCNLYPNGHNCTHTEENDRKPYWEVELGELYSIANITVYWRDTGSKRNNNVKVTVDGKLCHTFKSPVPNPSTITCNEPLAGRTVRLSKSDSSQDNYYLIPCKVEVWARTIFSSSTLDVKGSTPLTFDVTSLAPLTFDVTSLAPLKFDVTRKALQTAGSFLCGSVVTGICVALVLWLRHCEDRKRGRTSGSPSGDIVTTDTRETIQASPPYTEVPSAQVKCVDKKDCPKPLSRLC